MPNATSLLVAAGLGALALTACSGDQNVDQNIVITNDIPPDAEIEAVPPDESVPADESAGNEATNSD